MKLTDLLDEIDRLDKEATKGPWVVHPGVKYVYTTEAGMVLDRAWADQPDADLHLAALARTALPQLAKALQAVLAHLGQLEVKYDDYNAIDHIVHSITHELRHIITDTIGDDDAESRE